MTPKSEGAKPAQAWHPSVFIAEEMAARGWDRDDLAMRLGESFGRARLALDMYLDVGPYEPGLRLGGMADDFGRAFGADPDLFRNLEASWLASDPIQVDLPDDEGAPS